VDQQPVLDAGAGGDLHQFVGPAAAEFGVTHDLLQFLVEEAIALRPVDVGVGGREEEPDASERTRADQLFDSARVIVIDLWERLICYAERNTVCP
jgi:hypothetical protein